MQLLGQQSSRQERYPSSAATDLRGPTGAPAAVCPPFRGVIPPLATPAVPCALWGDTISFLVPLPTCWLSHTGCIPCRPWATFGRFPRIEGPRPFEVMPPSAGQGRQTQGVSSLSY